MLTAKDIAKWFVDRSKRDGIKLGDYRLLVLVYVSHCWYLEMTGAPLFFDKIEAWQSGPIIPNLYEGLGSIDQHITVLINKYVDNILEQIYISHRDVPINDLGVKNKGSPWEITINKYGTFAPILNGLIYDCYREYRRKRG